MTKFITNVLDRAAFFTTFGGKLVEIRGQYPENEFVLELSRPLIFYEAIGGWLPYRKFCNQRRSLKRKARQFNGLPAHFTGDKEARFTFGDLAKVVKR